MESIFFIPIFQLIILFLLLSKLFKVIILGSHNYYFKNKEPF